MGKHCQRITSTTPKNNKLSYSGATVQTKIKCLACGRNNHKMSDCKIPKDKLQCNFCKSKGSHMTKVCQKKARENKTNKEKNDPPKKNNDDKTRKGSKSPSGRKRDTSKLKKRTPSEEEGDTSAMVQHLLDEEMTDDPPSEDEEEFFTPEEDFSSPDSSPISSRSVSPNPCCYGNKATPARPSTPPPPPLYTDSESEDEPDADDEAHDGDSLEEESEVEYEYTSTDSGVNSPDTSVLFNSTKDGSSSRRRSS